MRLSLQTDFALRTLMYLAAGKARATKVRATVDEVATFYGISVPHVAKVVNRLARLGYVRGIRGAGGGIELARPPQDVSIGEVVQAFEGNMHLLECVGTDDVCVIQPFCKLRGVLANAEQVQMEYLRSVSLDQVVPRKREMGTVAAPNQQ